MTTITSLKGVPMDTTKCQRVLDEVYLERTKQHEKFGEQDHCPKVWPLIIGEEFGEVQRAVLEAGEFDGGRFKLPEVRSKLVDGKGSYRKELIETAAVCVAAVEALDRGAW